MAEGERKTLAVLVVDDNPVDQELVAIHIGKAWPFERELELEFAADGGEALDKIRTKRFALVVLDWKLPLMGEGEVLRQLRRQGVRIPVVVISALEREAINADLDKLAAAHVHKDTMNPDTFHRAIARALALVGLAVAPNPSPGVTAGV